MKMLSDKISNRHSFFRVWSAHMNIKKNSPSFINSLFIETKYSYFEFIGIFKKKPVERIEMYKLCKAPSNKISNTRPRELFSSAKARQ